MKKSKEKFDAHILKRGTDATQSRTVRPLPARLRALSLPCGSACATAAAPLNFRLLPAPCSLLACAPQRDRNATTVGPLLLGFFLFVVVGSAFLQIIRSASMGGAQGPPPQ